jgi:hypothetical protein
MMNHFVLNTRVCVKYNKNLRDAKMNIFFSTSTQIMADLFCDVVVVPGRGDLAGFCIKNMSTTPGFFKIWSLREDPTQVWE